MSTNTNTNVTAVLSDGAFLTLVGKRTRTGDDVTTVTRHFKSGDQRATCQRALWLSVRKSDGATGEMLAAETGVSGGRVSQMVIPVTALSDSGIPVPSRAADWDAYVLLWAHVARIYKMSAKTVREHVKTVAALTTDSARRASWLALTAPESKSSGKRAARPNDGTSDTSADDAGSTSADLGDDDGKRVVAGSADTFAVRLAALVKEAETARIPDLDGAMALADRLSDVIGARLAGEPIPAAV